MDRKVLTVALKGTSEQLRDHFLTTMSARGAEMMKEEMEAMGPVRIKEVETAQQQIIAMVRQLEAEGVDHPEGHGRGTVCCLKSSAGLRARPESQAVCIRRSGGIRAGSGRSRRSRRIARPPGKQRGRGCRRPREEVCTTLKRRLPAERREAFEAGQRRASSRRAPNCSRFWSA